MTCIFLRKHYLDTFQNLLIRKKIIAIKEEMTVSFHALLGSMTEEMSTPILPDMTKYTAFRLVRENLSTRYLSWSSWVLKSCHLVTRTCGFWLPS